jgi:Flp pilus assembly pilin Flp
LACGSGHSGAARPFIAGQGLVSSGANVAMRVCVLSKHLTRFFAHQSGTTATEYCLIGFLISIIAVAAMMSIGTSTKSMFDKVIVVSR